jgi:hypothetical protein
MEELQMLNLSTTVTRCLPGESLSAVISPPSISWTAGGAADRLKRAIQRLEGDINRPRSLHQRCRMYFPWFKRMRGFENQLHQMQDEYSVRRNVPRHERRVIYTLLRLPLTGLSSSTRSGPAPA